MHVRKAHDELLKLAAAPAGLPTFVTASVLLDGLRKDNEDTETGERDNETVREKIESARTWFEILCGIGEDGKWLPDDLRASIRQDLSVIHDEIDSQGKYGPPETHFKRWPAVGAAVGPPAPHPDGA